MKYARIQAGIVAEIITPRFYEHDVHATGEDSIPTDATLVARTGDEIPIEKRFHPDFVATLVLIPEGATVSDGDTYDGAEFGPPPPAPARPAADMLAHRDALLAQAALRIAPLQDAVDLGIETGDDVAALTEWKQYRVDLNRIEQQAGSPGDVEWPAAPQ